MGTSIFLFQKFCLTLNRHLIYKVMDTLITLRNLVLAPYILKATSLIGVSRKVGGNQFRHSFATLGILLDYKYHDNSILLKASLLHDCVEDINMNLDEIRSIDEDCPD